MCLVLVVASAAINWSVILRLTMAIHAETHRQAFDLLNLFHLLHLTVASGAILAGFNVRSVIKLHVVGKQIDLVPRNGLSGSVSFGQLLDVLTVRLHDDVTIHTDIECGHGGVPRGLSPRMAVLAIDLEITCVLLVRKRERLVGLIALVIADHYLIIC